MVPRPTGTVTFLFTDIQGSTKLWQSQPEAMTKSHGRHNAILRAAIESNQGYVFEIVGDAFCAAFPSAERAVQAAVRSQLDLQSEPWGDAVIRVRMGIHTGKADLREDGLYSGYTSLSRVQRLMSAAHGSQCLLSSTTEPLTRDNLPAGVELRDLGQHRLKDMLHPEHIFQVVVPGLPVDFPALHTLESFLNNLPVQLTSFVGRQTERTDIRRLLAEVRLLTLVGPGGTGKTRLSLQAAADLLEAFPHGTWFVDLAQVTDPSQVANAALEALSLPAELYRPAIDMLCDHLREREILLILDNCEHLVDACAKLADRLLHAAPKLRILATSREPLGIAGEASYRVPSLGLPDPERLPSVDVLSQYEAVRLFIERARAAMSDFDVTSANAHAVAQICHRLDGIPLAIELAAVKVRALTAEQISKRLDDRFRLLTGGSRTALERYQTLRAALDWSYNLLSPAEQTLLRRLSIFSNGWNLEAAESICAGDGLEPAEVFSLLEQLVNKSLVTTETREDEIRYGILETLRQYARENLFVAGENELLHERHLAYYLEQAEMAAPHLVRPEQVEWLDGLDLEHDNLRAALEWSLGKERPESALRLSAAMGDFWFLHYHWREGARWLQRALDRAAQNASQSEQIAQGRAHYQDAILADAMDDVERLRSSAEAAYSLVRESTDRRDIAIAMYALGIACERREDNAAAQRLCEQSLAEFREMNDVYGMARTLSWFSISLVWKGERTLAEHILTCEATVRKAGERHLLAELLGFKVFEAGRKGDLQEAQDHLRKAEVLYEELGGQSAWPLYLQGFIAHLQNDFLQARSLYLAASERLGLMGDLGVRAGVIQNLGVLARQEGDLHTAQGYFEESLLVARHLGGTRAFVSARLALLGHVYWLQGRLETAIDNFRECLSMQWTNEAGYPPSAALILVTFLLLHQAPRTASQILSAVNSSHSAAANTRMDPIFKRDFERAIEETRAQIDPAEFQAAWAEGTNLSLAEACHLALKALDEL